MSNVEMLKKNKDLLDDSEALPGNIADSSAEDPIAESKPEKSSKKQVSKKLIKRIVIASVIIIAILLVVVSGIENYKNNELANQRSTRAAALEEAIAPIMHNYGLYDYTVKLKISEYPEYNPDRYNVYAEEFENLTFGEALNLLEELDGFRIDDPCGDGEIGTGLGHVYPGLNADYFYFRVDSIEAYYNQMFESGGITTPGIYCSLYGNKCLYEAHS